MPYDRNVYPGPDDDDPRGGMKIVAFLAVCLALNAFGWVAHVLWQHFGGHIVFYTAPLAVFIAFTLTLIPDKP